MKSRCPQLAAALLTLFAFNASATVLYVNVNNTSPTSPYTNWTTAATNIQDAIDASTNGDQILVTNGVYQTGGRVVYGSLTNRVVIDKTVTVQSINGPGTTVIRGNPVTGDSAVRCVYLTNGAVLIGFTLTNGSTRNAGDSTKEQSGGGLWCESTSAIVTNCVISNNSATNGGGGATSGSFYNCTFNNNSTPRLGGGVSGANLYNCLLTNNSGQGNNSWGGGAYMCFVSNCVLSGNSAFTGGAARSCTLNNCTVTNNHVAGSGVYSFLTQAGGLNFCTANDCLIGGNSASAGGGCSYSTLNECIVTGNSASSMVAHTTAH
jgi:hypothetical protein